MAPTATLTATPVTARTAIDTDGNTSIRVAASRMQNVLRYSNRNAPRPGHTGTALDAARTDLRAALVTDGGFTATRADELATKFEQDLLDAQRAAYWAAIAEQETADEDPYDA